MTELNALLSERKILIADGAWGTEFAKLGLGIGEAPEKWNIEAPEKVEQVAAGYVGVGADVILTNTFGGSSFKLKKAGIAAEVGEINRLGAEISRKAAGDSVLVFGSMGPTGEFMAPLGLVSEDEMVAAYAEQVKGLAAGGADGILVETQTDLGEAKAALKAAKENCDLPVVVSMTFDKGARGYATMMGVTPAQAAVELQAAGADIVGSNCGGGIDQMIEVISLIAPATDLPIWAKSNAGLPELIDGQTVFRQTPEEMAGHVGDLVAAGARIIGGCCGTTPEHIKALVEAAAQLG